MNLGLIITYVVITIYCLSLLLIFFYSLTILNLSVNYLKNKHQNNEAPKFNLLDPNEIPYVTVQLPIYNEKYVVPRLLENIAKLEYPKNKLEIQVLDDSTDDSVAETGSRRVPLSMEQLSPKAILLPSLMRTSFLSPTGSSRQ